MSRHHITICTLAIAALAGAIGLGGEPPAGGGGPPAPIVRLGDGTWCLYKGSLKVTTRRAGEDPEEVFATLELAYLGRGEAGGPGTGERKVLLLREAETPDDQRIAAAEAVSLIAGGDLTMRPEIPIEDRARASKFLFTYLPLGIFPPLSDPTPRQWRAPVRIGVLLSEPRDLPAEHRVEAGPGKAVRYSLRIDPGQRTSFLADRVEIPLRVTRLEQVHSLSPGDGRLLGYRSLLEVRVLEPGAEPSDVQVEIDLDLAEGQRLEGERREKLEADAEAAREVERALFQALTPDIAAARAMAFERDRVESRLTRFVVGLGRQVDAVVPLARERKLYGKPPPEFTLRDVEGREFRLSEAVRGKVTLLSFWGLDCPACKVEAPYLTRFHEKYRERGFQAVAVASEERDAPEKVIEYARTRRLTHIVLTGGSRAADLYDFDHVLPTAFWIDHAGRVVRRETGFRPEMAKEIERTIENLLRARDSAGPPKAPADNPAPRQEARNQPENP